MTKDFFRPYHDPARMLCDAFQTEAAKREGREPEEWMEAEVQVVWDTAMKYALQHRRRVPTLDEVRAAESSAMGHVDYEAKWAYGVAEKMTRLKEEKNAQS